MPSNVAVTLVFFVSVPKAFSNKSEDLIFLVYMFLSNKHRDRIYGLANKEASNEAGMRDQTEFKNKNFRYVL
jgi:hypothetical protein